VVGVVLLGGAAGFVVAREEVLHGGEDLFGGGGGCGDVDVGGEGHEGSFPKTIYLYLHYTIWLVFTGVGVGDGGLGYGVSRFGPAPRLTMKAMSANGEFRNLLTPGDVAQLLRVGPKTVSR